MSNDTPPAAQEFLYTPRKRFQHVWWKHIAFFIVTFFTTTMVGADRYVAFMGNFGRTETAPLDLTSFLTTGVWTTGLWYSGTILLILGAHEMGHYVACRWYRIDATLPYFLPLFLGFGPGIQIGTLGAVIRIREQFPTRKVLFDIGVAGPIAGFLIVVPAIFLGMSLSQMTTLPDVPLTIIGKPLLFRLARWAVFGPVPDGSIVNLHPVVWAAWFGMLATALNLLPFGQLDGGHITYATLGRIAVPISLLTVATAIVMTAVSVSWFLMTLLMLAMLILFGPRHPPVIDQAAPLDATRYALAVFALVMLVVCFTPFPIDIAWPW